MSWPAALGMFLGAASTLAANLISPAIPQILRRNALCYPVAVCATIKQPYSLQTRGLGRTADARSGRWICVCEI